MASCEHCGNEWDRALEIRVGGDAHVLDPFERMEGHEQLVDRA